MKACEHCGETGSGVRGCPQCGTLVCGDHLLPENHDCITIQASRRNIGDPSTNTAVGSEAIEDPVSASSATQPVVPRRTRGTDVGRGKHHIDDPARILDGADKRSPEDTTRVNDESGGFANEIEGTAAKLALVVLVLVLVLVLLFVVGLDLV